MLLVDALFQFDGLICSKTAVIFSNIFQSLRKKKTNHSRDLDLKNAIYINTKPITK